MGHIMGMVTPIIHGLYQVILRDSTVAPGNGKPNGKNAGLSNIVMNMYR